ncbi:Transcription initiation factor TFIID subunit 5 [Zea mays]|uniref:Transcription initiation factor TFIID subunit 5 n=1 Tax=Zea mays TaxID=4577 RepID=A0A3L6EF30_MAIZE|nr:Transcription initiation factor TFIID subunit 5 [Zea mays]
MYLQKTQAFVVLGVINEHITFEVSAFSFLTIFSTTSMYATLAVSPGQSSLISDDADVVALIGTSKDLAKQINQKEVHWGLLEDSVEEQMEKALAESDKIEAESNDADAEDNKARKSFVKRNTEGGKQNTSLKNAKKDKLVASSQNEDGCSHGERISTLDEGKRTYTLFQGHSGPVYSAAFSPFGDFLLSPSSDSTIRLWSTKLNANLVCYKGHNYPVWDVQFSPVGHYFASASHDRTARIWSIDKIQPLRIMTGHLSDVDCVQWHVNCNYIATGFSDKTVRLWDVQTGECIQMFIGHRSMVLSLTMSPDGRYMASGDEDGTIMIWDLSTDRCVSPLPGHSSCVGTLAFSCEGALLASGSADCTVKLWDVAFSTKALKTEDTKGSSSANRLRLLKSLPTKSAPVYSLRFSRRNLLFASGALA